MHQWNKFCSSSCSDDFYCCSCVILRSVIWVYFYFCSGSKRWYQTFVIVTGSITSLELYLIAKIFAVPSSDMSYLMCTRWPSSASSQRYFFVPTVKVSYHSLKLPFVKLCTLSMKSVVYFIFILYETPLSLKPSISLPTLCRLFTHLV